MVENNFSQQPKLVRSESGVIVITAGEYTVFRDLCPATMEETFTASHEVEHQKPCTLNPLPAQPQA